MISSFVKLPVNRGTIAIQSHYPQMILRGRLNVDSFIRCNRIFTVDQSVILYTATKIKSSKFSEVRSRIRDLFA